MPTSSASVVIVLAAYNGARFIGEQIESLRAQTHSDWLLLVRDDSSTDETRRIVQAIAGIDRRVVLLPGDGKRVGAWRNFAALLQDASAAGGEYVFLADQDDVWIPHKIECSLAALREEESLAGRACPVLVHADLRVVDDGLRVIHDSYQAYQAATYSREQPLRTLLLHGAPMGCTIACNRALLDFALPIPADAAHDWWLAQCGAAAGEIVDIPEQLVLYRQHGANVVGSSGRRAPLRDLIANPTRGIPAVLAEFRRGVRQAVELSRRVAERPSLVPPERAVAIHAYAEAFATVNPLRRISAIVRSGVRPRRALSHPIFYALALSQPPLERR